MKLSRQSRFRAALVALFGVLFMQFAVASYACPGLASAGGSVATMAASMESQDMSGCMGMDPVQPSLCHAYGQVGNQSLDKPGAPVVQAFVPSTLILALHPVDVAPVLDARRPEVSLLSRSTAPPLAIQHCCFRI